MSPFDETVAKHKGRHQPVLPGRHLLAAAALLGGLHLLVAVPHFIVRVILGTPSRNFPGVRNFAPVNDKLWRGSAPASAGYPALADMGIASVIDLRAEAEALVAREPAAATGINVIHIPIRDGQTPTAKQVDEIAEAINGAAGATFVHCQAGVGRTGSVVAALRVAAGRTPGSALVEALRFGPLSLEQQAFVLRCDRPDASLLPIVVASRIIDSPRRLLSRIRG
ncbi:MAG: dual specificity protein phosphatase family protein [bacterium]|nr:dual specificity protein phosphatase family protein [bacterium]